MSATPPAEQTQVQPPAGQLGLNPANQYQPDPTPTAANDRSVPAAPVVGGGEREAPPPVPADGAAAAGPGVNPANQFQEEPTPTAGPDRSVPDAPVVGGGEREAPPGDDGPQAAARLAGGAWPPLLAESKA